MSAIIDDRDLIGNAAKLSITNCAALTQIYNMIVGSLEDVARQVMEHQDYVLSMNFLCAAALSKNLINNRELYKLLGMEKHGEAEEVYVQNVLDFSVCDKLGGYTKFIQDDKTKILSTHIVSMRTIVECFGGSIVAFTGGYARDDFLSVRQCIYVIAYILFSKLAPLAIKRLQDIGSLDNVNGHNNDEKQIIPQIDKLYLDYDPKSLSLIVSTVQTLPTNKSISALQMVITDGVMIQQTRDTIVCRDLLIPYILAQKTLAEKSGMLISHIDLQYLEVIAGTKDTDPIELMITDLSSAVLGDELDPVGQLVSRITNDTQELDLLNSPIQTFLFGYSFEMKYCVCARMEKSVQIAKSVRADEKKFDKENILNERQYDVVLKDYALHAQYEDKKTTEEERKTHAEEDEKQGYTYCEIRHRQFLAQAISSFIGEYALWQDQYFLEGFADGVRKTFETYRKAKKLNNKFTNGEFAKALKQDEWVSMHRNEKLSCVSSEILMDPELEATTQWISEKRKDALIKMHESFLNYGWQSVKWGVYRKRAMWVTVAALIATQFRKIKGKIIGSMMN